MRSYVLVKAGRWPIDAEQFAEDTFCEFPAVDVVVVDDGESLQQFDRWQGPVPYSLGSDDVCVATVNRAAEMASYLPGGCLAGV
jgi:hypothetical protein